MIQHPQSLTRNYVIYPSTSLFRSVTYSIGVPEHAPLSSFIPSDPQARIDSRFSTWRASIAPPLARTGTFERAYGKLRLAIPMPASMELADPHLFVENERLVDYAAAQTFHRLGDTLTVEIQIGRAHV